LLLFLFASIGKLFPEPELWILIYLLRHTFTPPIPGIYRLSTLNTSLH
jgi:hypothetical protein